VIPAVSALAARPPAPPAATAPAAVAGVAPPARRSSVLPLLLVFGVVLLGGAAAGAWLMWPTVSRALGLAGAAKASQAARVTQDAPPAPETSERTAGAGGAVDQGGHAPAEAAAAAGAAAQKPAAGAPLPGTEAARAAQPPSSGAAETGSSTAAPAGEPAAEPRGAVAPAPALSGVAVAVVGDQGLVGAVSSYLMGELGGADLEPLDAATLPELEGLVRGQGDVATGELLRGAREAGLAVVVLARVDPAGQRELVYMNRYDTAYTSRVTVTCLDVASGRPRGRPASATVEYTALTAQRVTEPALGALIGQVVGQAR